MQVSQGWSTQAAAVKGAGEAGGKPIVQFRRVATGPVSTLNVSKWSNAFRWGGTNNTTGLPIIRVVDNFIEVDPDSFAVYVIDPAAKNPPKVHISTSSDATGHDIVLTETGVNTGQYWSKGWLLLTSVPTDDAYKANGIADNAQGDPTFLVKLGDTVAATYGGAKATATVPVVKVVKLHINILRNSIGGTSVASEEKVQEDVNWANEIYAPAGILFKATIQSKVNPPAGVNLSNGLESFDGNLDDKGKIRITTEEKNLLGATGLRTPANDDIEVYYVNFLALDGKDTFSLGESFSAAAVPDAKYEDSVVVSADHEAYTTLAHEIGHVLLNDGGHPDGMVATNIVNLMAFPYQLKRQVTDSRRITAGQADKMLSERPNLLTNP